MDVLGGEEEEGYDYIETVSDYLPSPRGTPVPVSVASTLGNANEEVGVAMMGIGSPVPDDGGGGEMATEFVCESYEEGEADGSGGAAGAVSVTLTLAVPADCSGEYDEGSAGAGAGVG
ncbi:hypothetical protein HK102_008367 [Quaeritorhiza haematococci]|nr:hypothetical protein HK102_008367 [Quaeritorhiza haematococci]